MQTTANPADAAVTASGQTFTNVQFGDYQLGTISGEVFQDVNGDGAPNGSDPGLAGWNVQLTDPASGSVLASQVSDGSGNYRFSNLAPGTYRIRETLQSGWQLTTLPSVDVAATTSGNVTTGVNFGNFLQVSIGGQVYLDN